MRLFIILFFLFLHSVFAYAQSTRTGFSMLESAPTPAALSINEASTAIPMGSASIYLNPATLPFDNSSSLDVSYSSWIDDSNYLFGGANFINGKRAFSIGVYNSKIDGFEQRNGPGNSNGEFSISYLSLSGALAYDFDFISLGIAGQYLNEENAQFQASGYAFNFGAASEFFDDKLRAGISILNIGKLNNLNNLRTELPEIFRAGLAVDVFEFTPPKNSDLPILFSLSTDFVQPLNDRESIQPGEVENNAYFNFGTIFNIAEVLELSAGYKTGDTAKPVSFGIGVITDLLKVNYALIPFKTGFGTLHSIGIQYKF